MTHLLGSIPYPNFPALCHDDTTFDGGTVITRPVHALEPCQLMPRRLIVGRSIFITLHLYLHNFILQVLPRAGPPNSMDYCLWSHNFSNRRNNDWSLVQIPKLFRRSRLSERDIQAMTHEVGYPIVPTRNSRHSIFIALQL